MNAIDDILVYLCMFFLKKAHFLEKSHNFTAFIFITKCIAAKINKDNNFHCINKIIFVQLLQSAGPLGLNEKQ